MLNKYSSTRYWIIRLCFYNHVLAVIVILIVLVVLVVIVLRTIYVITKTPIKTYYTFSVVVR